MKKDFVDCRSIKNYMSVSIYTHKKNIEKIINSSEIDEFSVIRITEVSVKKIRNTNNDYIEILLSTKLSCSFELLHNIYKYLQPFNIKIYFASKYYYENKGINPAKIFAVLIN